MITRSKDYPEGSVGAEVNRVCDELNVKCPGAGDVLFEYWADKLNAAMRVGLQQAWEATA